MEVKGEIEVSTVRAVTVALRAFEVVAMHQPIGVSDLARRLGEPKSTAQRALASLHEMGWIEQEIGESRARWVPTTKILALASPGGQWLRKRTLAVMHELAERTNENIHLSVRSGRGIVIIEKIESSQSVRPHDPVGEIVPMHATSSGKAILAWAADSDVDDVLGHGLERFTDETRGADRLRAELARIRELGYSANHGEWREDVRGVAAAIIDPDGHSRSAISMAVPAHRLPDSRIAELGELVRDVVARRLSATPDAGAPPDPNPRS